MNKILCTLLIAFIIPCASLAQQTDLDKILDKYEVQQKVSAQSRSPETEIVRLRNQMIDLRVERDALKEENDYLNATIRNMRGQDEIHPECAEVECIPVSDVINEKVISYVIYSLSLYRLAEVIIETTPQENVEAHKKAQKIMTGVKSDLDVLGFDTRNMQDYPALEELLEQLEIAQGSAAVTR